MPTLARRAKEHGTTYGRLINTATGLLLYGGAGQSNYVAAKAGINAFTEAVATEMAPYGVTVNAIMPGANTRLAQIGWRMARGIDQAGGTVDGFDPRDPVHVAEFGCFLASGAAAGISHCSTTPSQSMTCRPASSPCMPIAVGR